MAHLLGARITSSLSRDCAETVRDDRIFPETRWVGACIPPFLVVAFILLYLFPNDTATHFAWTIKPTMTPLLMGGGYISGSYFFIRLIMGGKWHWFTLGFLPVTAFTWFMGLATFLHWEKFNHSHASFYAWLILYVVTPFLVPILWFRNRVTDPGTPDASDVLISSNVRMAAGVVGATLLAIAMLLFIFPEVAINIWPWNLTPLTARVVGGLFALPGVAGLMCATDARWSAWRIVLQAIMLGVALTLLGALRAWSEFKQDNPMTWVFVIGMLLLLVCLGAIHVIMEARRRGSATA